MDGSASAILFAPGGSVRHLATAASMFSATSRPYREPSPPPPCCAGKYIRLSQILILIASQNRHCTEIPILAKLKFMASGNRRLKFNSRQWGLGGRVLVVGNFMHARRSTRWDKMAQDGAWEVPNTYLTARMRFRKLLPKTPTCER